MAAAFEALVAPQLGKQRPVDYGSFAPQRVHARQARAMADWNEQQDMRGRIIAGAKRHLEALRAS